MQAMSFALHIPLVCFGIAFPAMVVFLEGLWLRTGDPLYRALAKRCSKAMVILFAIGVVTGTILSFEMGLLWPNFMATFGDVFGLAFGIEGFSFFMEAIFIAIYVYGLSGSLMVISVNGWMKPAHRLLDPERGQRREAQRHNQRDPVLAVAPSAQPSARVDRGDEEGGDDEPARYMCTSSCQRFLLKSAASG